MGVYYETYIGPFLSVKEKTVQIPRIKSIFKSESGKIHKNHIKFDPEDGTPVHKIDEPYTENVKINSWNGILKQLDESDLDENALSYFEYMSSPKGCFILLGNRKGFGKSIEQNRGGYFDLEAVDIQKKKVEFEAEYLKEIEIIKSEFEVSIGYGVIVYGS